MPDMVKDMKLVGTNLCIAKNDIKFDNDDQIAASFMASHEGDVCVDIANVENRLRNIRMIVGLFAWAIATVITYFITGGDLLGTIGIGLIFLPIAFAMALIYSIPILGWIAYTIDLIILFVALGFGSGLMPIGVAILMFFGLPANWFVIMAYYLLGGVVVGFRILLFWANKTKKGGDTALEQIGKIISPSIY